MLAWMRSRAKRTAAQSLSFAVAIAFRRVLLAASVDERLFGRDGTNAPGMDSFTHLAQCGRRRYLDDVSRLQPTLFRSSENKHNREPPVPFWLECEDLSIRQPHIYFG